MYGKKVLFFILFAAIMLTGCSKKQKTQENNLMEEIPQITEIKNEQEIPQDAGHEGEEKSKLTGLWVPEDIAKRRPFAVMFNNIKYASPHSGIGEADILYEALVEGGITRLMGLFEDFKSDRIGSVRSARHYYVSFADEYDAIYVHFGHTKYATSKISALGIDTLSGLSSIGGVVFYRDNSVKAPHNAFTSYEKLQKGMEQKNYRTDYKKGFEGHFKFFPKDTDLTSDHAVNKIVLGYSNYMSPYFEYDQKNKVYKRFQFNTEHKDRNTGEQLSYKNVIIQLVKEWDIDKNGYQTMDIENSSGKGYYITNGKAADITWKKNESTKKMRYYSMDGEELIINPGKTFISIFPNDKTKGIQLTE